MYRRHILIVDDDPANLEVFDAILGDEHFLAVARDGVGALAAARHQPSLILLDVGLPNMDGFEVCQRLKADPLTACIPVIFVTGSGEPIDEAKGFEAGGVDYIVKPISAAILRARVRTHLSLTNINILEQAYRESIYMMGEAGHYNDNDTGLHIWRMASYSRVLAEAQGWPRASCEMIEFAAAMHDTGKIGIPDKVLRKPGPLDAQEWETMKTHARIGWEILSKSNAPIFRMAAEIAHHHHEKWDGSGYPHGLSEEHIEESARIVAIADVFDALSMKRPYKEPWTLEKILEMLRENSGRHFDPELIDVFFSRLPRILEIKDGWDRRESAQ